MVISWDNMSSLKLSHSPITNSNHPAVSSNMTIAYKASPNSMGQAIEPSAKPQIVCCVISYPLVIKNSYWKWPCSMGKLIISMAILDCHFDITRGFNYGKLAIYRWNSNKKTSIHRGLSIIFPFISNFLWISAPSDGRLSHGLHAHPWLFGRPHPGCSLEFGGNMS